jgi:uncharacterized protein YqkB
MNISSRIKQVLSISLVSVLAATVMPSQVLAYEEYEYDDSVVTVEVDLGDGGDGDTGCEGISTLELPDRTLRARFDQLEPGLSRDPDIIDYLTWYWDDYGSDGLSQWDLNDYVVNLDNRLGSDTPTLVPNDDIDELLSISYSTVRFSDEDLDLDGDIDSSEETYSTERFVEEDTNQDGIIDGSDAPDYLTETRRAYVTDSFSVGFDANDCLTSEDIGLLLAGRGYVKRWDQSAGAWVTADVLRENVDEDERISGVVNRAEAHLISPVSLFNNSLPRQSARSVVVFGDGEVGGGEGLFDWSPIAFGDEGQPQMRAALRIYGANPTGKYQTKFYYVLEVGDEEYFDGLLWFVFDYFDEGWLP